MENVNMVPDMDQAYDESLIRIVELLETKRYFQARDELLKHNEVEIGSRCLPRRDGHP